MPSHFRQMILGSQVTSLPWDSVSSFIKWAGWLDDHFSTMILWLKKGRAEVGTDESGKRREKKMPPLLRLSNFLQSKGQVSSPTEGLSWSPPPPIVNALPYSGNSFVFTLYLTRISLPISKHLLSPYCVCVHVVFPQQNISSLSAGPIASAPPVSST